MSDQHPKPNAARHNPATRAIDEELEKLRQLIVSLNEVAVLQAVANLLHNGASPHDILTCFQKALAEIGEMYQRGEYFVAGLILSGEIMRQSMRLLMPRLVREEGGAGRSGLVILGTIEGDIHDLGKNMASYFLEAHGFEVVDLGVDVPPRVFLKEILQREPDAVGVSLLLTSCLEPLARLIHLVRETYHGRQPPPIFIGGGVVSAAGGSKLAAEVAKLGVDYIVRDAYETLNLCLNLTRRTGPGAGAADK